MERNEWFLKNRKKVLLISLITFILFILLLILKGQFDTESTRRYLPELSFQTKGDAGFVKELQNEDIRFVLPLEAEIQEDGVIEFYDTYGQYAIGTYTGEIPKTLVEVLPERFYSHVYGYTNKSKVMESFSFTKEGYNITGYAYSVAIRTSVRTTKAVCMCYVVPIGELTYYMYGITETVEAWGAVKDTLDTVLSMCEFEPESGYTSSTEGVDTSQSTYTDSLSSILNRENYTTDCEYSVDNGVLYVYWYNNADVVSIKAYSPEGKRLHLAEEYDIPGEYVYFIGNCRAGEYKIETESLEELYGVHLEIYEQSEFEDYIIKGIGNPNGGINTNDS